MMYGVYNVKQATYNKNEQQDANSNAELQTKWTKTTWKTLKETNKRDHNRSIKP